MKAKIKLNTYTNNQISISGSKNSSLPIIASCILCDEHVIVNNVPNIKDITTLIDIMRKMGYNINFINNTVIYKPSISNKNKYHFKKIKKLRGSYYIIGSLIGLFDYCDFSFLLPGGCNFINRPINYHIDAFKHMGLNVKIRNDKIFIQGNKHSIVYSLVYPSLGATINIILSTCKLTDKTIIYNASIEPEVIDLCIFLNSMGCNITIRNRTINIEGKTYFHSTNYSVMEDRIEAGTFLILGAIHNGITIKNVNKSHLEPLITLLEDIGYTININHNIITNKDTISINNNKNNIIKPFKTTLDPFPSIPTDLGPLLCVLASKINGTSFIVDNVYHNRLTHIEELKKFNIDIKYENNSIVINGNNKITSSVVKGHDLRCTAALVLASTLSNNYSYVYNIEYLFRGYENIGKKLNDLGIEFSIR